MIKKIISISTNNNILLIFLFIGLVLASLLETMSIGFVPLLVQFMLNPGSNFQKYESIIIIKNFFNFYNLDSKNFLIFFIFFVVFFYLVKNFFFLF